ncbi:MAG: hypothetical protein P3X23_004990 [Thermosynechococcus sp. Uc]|uniref:hypothetical protein n=1 Tax=Thermosynechococcus sp. Uc TaxID=3034853 RepID=UPI0019E2D3A9|nr:hypothetical protein [Thermosynechococcus sp. Uc]MDM7326458.1 hypothetical protein [Thermosynechococcus sp. Uc]HIK25995.1 hypothetical protein [Thermosynechococcus sp. M46_R2017_013]
MTPEELLTVSECQEIDQLLLPAADRFAIRLAVYAQRYLQAQTEVTPLEELTEAQVYELVAADPQLQAEEERQGGFMTWYGQILISALKQLRRIAENEGVPIAELTVPQISRWFAQQCQERLRSSPPSP